jgi:hypothetical protein
MRPADPKAYGRAAVAELKPRMKSTLPSTGLKLAAPTPGPHG